MFGAADEDDLGRQESLMSRATNWISRNLSLGGLVRHVGAATGKVARCGIEGVGMAAGLMISDATKKEECRLKSRDFAKKFDTGVAGVSSVVGDKINTVVQAASIAVGEVSGAVVRLAGASDDTVATTRKVGTFVGSVAVGVAAGTVVAGAAVSLGAAAGTSGAAATTSGLATMGGGAIAAGGGGMAAGQAVIGGIVAAAGASGVASLQASEVEED